MLILCSLVGHWSGLKRDSSQEIAFTIYAQSADGSVEGAGSDDLGPFAIHGDNSFTFILERLYLRLDDDPITGR